MKMLEFISYCAILLLTNSAKCFATIYLDEFNAILTTRYDAAILRLK